jgi:serine/threonine protein kinase/Tfp pilus assembly protein PilF
MKCPKCESENTDTARFCSECGASLAHSDDAQPAITKTIETPKEELTTGSIFAGRYQIIEELGKGGMGKVYKAIDIKLNEKIALKLIKPEISSDEKVIKRFSNELKIARKIGHRNVGRMFELMEDDGTHFITMEYVPGQDLKGLIRQSAPLGIARAITIAQQTCEGLSEAHSLGVVHRDLKPSNIMIDEDGNARIMDFGIARSAKEKGITGAGVIIGTPEYMSPEQVDGKEADQRSDIYSLGVVIYEMLTGKLPFEGDTPLSIAVQHRSDKPEDPKKLNRMIPDDLNQAILKCMEKAKGERYQAIEELSAALDRIQQGIPSTETTMRKRKPATSKEITVSFSAKRLLLPAILLIVLVIVGLFLWHPWSQKVAPSTSSEKPSVAVLPFEDFSRQKDQEYLCLGIASELINRLNKIQDLWVPARGSSFSFRGSEASIQQIGDSLNVQSVLMGTLQKDGNKIRISVELIDVAGNNIIWSDTYERNEGDIFDLQDDVTLAIVEKLKVNLLGEESAALVKRYTENVEAYNLYLKGRHFWNERTEEGFEQTIRYLRDAIEKDPSYALAYAGIADTYNILGWYSHLSPFEAFPKAKVAALKALEIDDDLAEAHASLAAYFLWHEWDWISAEREFKRSIELNPGYATAHHWYADCLTVMRRSDEAITEMKRAQELDPLSLIINTDLAKEYLYARQYDQAINQCEKTLELNPNFYRVYKYFGQAYVQTSQLEEAIQVFQNAKDLSKGHPAVLAWLGYVYGLSGRIIEAQGLFEELENISKQQYVSPIYYSFVHIGLGDIDRAFIWLEKAYDERSSWLIYIHRSPIYESLHTDDRYNALLRKMNLE